MKTNQPTLKRPLARITSIFFGMLTFLMLFSCDRPSADKPNSEKFTLYSEDQSLVHIDIAHEGRSHGDIYVFEALLTEKNNNVVGRLTGKLVTASLPNKNNNPEQVHEDRFITMIFEFDDGSTILVNGITHYTVGVFRRTMNDPRDAAIIGGTGKYMGARGQVTTTRIADQRYELKFEILP